jgi:hypothetical protein
LSFTPAISIRGQGGAAAGKNTCEADHAHHARDVVDNSVTSWPTPFAAGNNGNPFLVYQYSQSP